MPRALQTVPIPPPTRGTQVNIVEPEIPEGFVWKSQNMLDRYGQFRTRPGLGRFSPTPLPDRIIGGDFYRAADPLSNDTVVVATLSGLFRPFGTAWNDITGVPAPLHGDPKFHARFSTFSITGSRFLIMVNNVDTPRVWDGVAATFSELGGTPPETARDTEVCFNRALLYNVVESAVRAPARLRISDFNNPASWPANLVLDATDTGDNGVAVRSLNRSTALLYNDNSIWIITGQAGTFPFTLDILQAEQPGPLNPACVVSARGTHYVLASDFRIYAVSQLGVQNLSEQSVSKILDTTISSVTAARAFGEYRAGDQTVWFWFPSSDSDDPRRAISINTNSGAMHFHSYPIAVSASWRGVNVSSVTWLDLIPFTWANVALTYPTWESFGGTLTLAEFVGAPSGVLYRPNYDLDDDGAPIDMQWENPPRFLGGVKNVVEFDTIENTFESPPAGPLVAVDVGVTDTDAEAAGPTYTQVGVHDTRATFRQPLSWSGAPPQFPLRGRLMNWRWRVSSHQPVKFKGAIGYVSVEEIQS